MWAPPTRAPEPSVSVAWRRERQQREQQHRRQSQQWLRVVLAAAWPTGSGRDGDDGHDGGWSGDSSGAVNVPPRRRHREKRSHALLLALSPFDQGG